MLSSFPKTLCLDVVCTSPNIKSVRGFSVGMWKEATNWVKGLLRRDDGRVLSTFPPAKTSVLPLSRVGFETTGGTALLSNKTSSLKGQVSTTVSGTYLVVRSQRLDGRGLNLALIRSPFRHRIFFSVQIKFLIFDLVRHSCPQLTLF